MRLVDYIIYTDMIYHGTEEEKDLILFSMLDEQGDGKITLKELQNFWKKFMHMNGELMQVKMQYNEEARQITTSIFDQITRINAEEPKRQVFNKRTNKEEDFFEFSDFQSARQTNPELFEWLEYPTEQIGNFLEQQNHQERKYTLDEVLKYHKAVRDEVSQMLEEVMLELDIPEGELVGENAVEEQDNSLDFDFLNKPEEDASDSDQ